MKKSMYFALIILIIITSVVYFGVLRHSGEEKTTQIDGVLLADSTDIADFNLTNNLGKPFTKSNLKGRWTMIFFGFTNCGMVCPTTMAALNKMYQILEKELPQQQLPQVVLISVDPERDTVERLNDYVTAFNPHFSGARGDMAMTQALEKQLHIVSVKMQVEGQSKEHYTINHSAEIMLFNPDGKLQAFLSYPHQAEQMAKDYKLIVSRG